MKCLQDPLGFIACIHLVKRPLKAIRKGRQGLEGDWANPLSVTFQRTNQNFLTAQDFSFIEMVASTACHRPVANQYTVQGFSEPLVTQKHVVQV